MKEEKQYTLNFKGDIYNLEEIKELYSVTKTDTKDILLDLFLEYGEELLKKINGEFYFHITNNKTSENILVRDKMGIKPLYYTIKNNQIFVEDRIDKLLEKADMEAVINKDSLKRIFGIGPCIEEGYTLFKDIYQVKPGHYNVYIDGKVLEVKYFHYINVLNLDTKEEAKEKIKSVLEDACKIRCKEEEVNIMLSGGLDSSIVTNIMHKNNKKINSFSVDYEDNDKNFKANNFQSTRDSDYIKLMVEKTNSNHTEILLKKEDLIQNLKDSVIARERPGMADIDSSLLSFCKKMKENGIDKCFSGECSDEIFLGYPWLYGDVIDEHIPFVSNIDVREEIIKKDIFKNNEVREYIFDLYNHYNDNLKFSDVIDENSKKYIKNNYLTIKLFMPVLIERAERISEFTGLKIEVPFADNRIFEYVFSLPYNYKINKEFNEKSILKEIYLDELPNEIIGRKKSPFPKTYDPLYLEMVEEEITKILNNENSKISKIINIEFLKNMLENKGRDFKGNFFGQLMTYPQFLAYIIQIEIWMNEYKIKFENI